MKRCPKCSRTFPDDNQKFCTVDGGLLVNADKPFDPNATIQGSANLALPVEPPPEKPVSSQPPPDFSATIATPSSAPTVVFPKKTGPTGSPTAANLQPPTMPPTPPSVPLPPTQPSTPVAPTPSAPPPPPQQGATLPPSQTVPLAQTLPASQPLPPQPSAPLPPTQTAGLPPTQTAALPPTSPVVSAPLPQSPAVAATPQKKSKLPLVLGILAILLVLGVGGVVAAFFLVVKPRLAQLNANRGVVVVPNANENSNANTNANTNTNQPTPEPEKTQPEFVPPAGAVKFTNSAANLDGKLAEHYFDFSFYYPNEWKPDPKAGKPGAINFAKVEETQEDDTGVYLLQNASVSWYNSNGSFAADTSVFQDRVKSLEAQIAKGFPGFEKVSEGETKVNSLQAYEFRFKGTFKNTGKGDLPYWGRVIFIPSGDGEKNGAVVSLLATSLSSDVSGAEDLGDKGGMATILESFRFGKKL